MPVPAAHYIPEVRESAPIGDWKAYEATGRACVVCPCGLNTGFINKDEALQAYKDHGAGLPMGEYRLMSHNDTQSGPAHAPGHGTA